MMALQEIRLWETSTAADWSMTRQESGIPGSCEDGSGKGVFPLDPSGSHVVKAGSYRPRVQGLDSDSQGAP